MAGTPNPSGTNSGTPDSFAQGVTASSALPPTDAPVGAPSANGSGVPSQQDIISAFWKRYQAAEQAYANGPDDPNYYAAVDELKTLAPQLSKMSDAQAALDAKKEAGTKAVPSADQPFIAADGTEGWSDGKGGTIKGTWGDFQKWQAATTAQLAQQLKEAQAGWDQANKDRANDIAQGNLDVKTAQNQAMAQLNDYKAQMAPMVSALGAARDIADMTMRGPVIPSLLQNMAPPGTNAALVGMINGMPGVTKIPMSSGIAQDQPLPVNVATLGTQIAQNALKGLTPWVQEASKQAQGNSQAPSGGQGGGQTGGTQAPPQHPPIPNSQPNLAPYMAPTAGAPPGSMPMPTPPAPSIMTGPSGAPSSLMNNNASLPQSGLPPGANGGLMMGPSGYTAGINPQTGVPLPMH